MGQLCINASKRTLDLLWLKPEDYKICGNVQVLKQYTTINQIQIKTKIGLTTTVK